MPETVLGGVAYRRSIGIVSSPKSLGALKQHLQCAFLKIQFWTLREDIFREIIEPPCEL